MNRPALLGIWLLCLLAALVSLVWAFAAMVARSGRAWSIVQAYDRVANAATGGDPREYVSERAWRYRNERKWGALVRLVELVDPDHFREYRR